MTTWNTDPSKAPRDGTPIIGDFGEGPTMAIFDSYQWSKVTLNEHENNDGGSPIRWLTVQRLHPRYLIRWQNMPSTEG